MTKAEPGSGIRQNFLSTKLNPLPNSITQKDFWRNPLQERQPVSRRDHLGPLDPVFYLGYADESTLAFASKTTPSDSKNSSRCTPKGPQKI